MHYYQFNIGDYMKSTHHLSLMEDLAYRRLLDRYYDTEKPLESDIDKLCRLIRMSDHKTETQQVLDEFFSLTQKGWIQKRVSKELGAYSRKADAARANGKLGGRPKITQSVTSANPPETQLKAKQETLTNNHKPITNNQEPIKKTAAKRTRFSPPSVNEVAGYWSERTGQSSQNQAEQFVDHYESVGWKRGKTPMKDWKATVRTWISRNAENGNGSNQPSNHKPKLSAVERVHQATRARQAERERNGGTVAQDG